MANPIKALKEWLRVLKPGGSITLVLPDQRYNFDHNRPAATFAHLLDDHNNNTTEHDLTHLNEILLLHDYEMDAGVTNMAHFKQRSLSNINNRCLHQHVFSVPLLKQLFKFLNLKIVVAHNYFQHHLVIVGIKQ
jgi:ubiquinone/menaquinone biosynthesis C-methylase UbiE